MSVSERDGRLLVHCFSGKCSQKVLIAELQARGLFPKRREWVTGGAVHVRRDGPQGKRTWWSEKGVKPATLPLYNVEVLGDAANLAVLTEGESATDALAARGVTSVGTVTGASSTPDDEALRPLLSAARIVLWQDADGPGAEHMHRVGTRLLELGHRDVRILTWPDAPEKGDAADFAGTDAELQALIEAAEPLSPSQHGRRHLKLTRASDIQIAPIRWLWDERIALGSFGLIAGREGLGKSTWAYWLVARITRGELPGRMLGSPRAVVICASEDSWSHTIVPRLMAAGADLKLVYRVEVVTSEGVGGYLVFPKDNDELEEVVKELDAALILLDPLLSRLDAGLDTHKDAEVRRALEPISALADRTNSAALGLIHVNKGVSDDPLTTIMGSRAFAAVARTVFYFARDPNDEFTTLVGVAKNNLGRPDLPASRIRIEGSVPVRETDDGPVLSSRVVFMDDAEKNTREAPTESAMSPEHRGAADEAASWLQDYLEGSGGSAESAAVKRAARAAGHSATALHRARQKIGALSAAEPGSFPRRTLWSLPVVPPVGESGMTRTTGTTSTTEDAVVPVVPVVPVAQTPRGLERLPLARARTVGRK